MKRFINTIAVFMLIILCLGSMSFFFDSGGHTFLLESLPDFEKEDEKKPPGNTGNKEPEETVCSHVDADDNELCDLCGASYSDGIECSHRDADDNELCDLCGASYSDGIECSHRDADDNAFCDLCGKSFSDVQDLFGGTVMSSYTFDESVSFDYLNKVALGGFNPAIKYGQFTTEDGYAKFYTTSADVGVSLDSFFGISLQEESEHIYFNEFDYLTVDFDIWTDSEYILPINFVFMNEISGGSASTSNLKIYNNSSDGIGPYLTINGNEFDYQYKVLESKERTHITFVIKSNSYVMNGLPKVSVYVDGELKSIDNISITNLGYKLAVLRMQIPQHSVVEDTSLCIDNFTVSTFGSGSGYKGALNDIFGDSTKTLTDCVDSVLYEKK